MEPRGKKYPGNGIDVYYEPRICIHVALCVHGLPSVFDPKARPWIRPEHATAGELARVIDTCPTGALHYVRTDGGPAEAVPPFDSIQSVKGGPLYVHGDITIQTEDGSVIRKDTRVALCRCGKSQNKPFCDNSHVAAKFEG